MAFHQTALVLAVPSQLDKEARRSHVRAVHGGPKGSDDPIDWVNEDIGAVVAGRYLMGTVAWC